MFIKENQNKSSKSFLRNQSTLKLPLAHVCLETPYLWHCTLWVTPQSDKCLRADIKKHTYSGNHVAVCVGLIACLVDQRFCVLKPASATYLSLWTGRQNLSSSTKKKRINKRATIPSSRCHDITLHSSA